MDTIADSFKTRERFLVAIKGVLQVEAESAEEANHKAGEWIAAAGKGQAESDEVTVGWLRIEPFEENHPGFRREGG